MAARPQCGHRYLGLVLYTRVHRGGGRRPFRASLPMRSVAAAFAPFAANPRQHRLRWYCRCGVSPGFPALSPTLRTSCELHKRKRQLPQAKRKYGKYADGSEPFAKSHTQPTDADNEEREEVYGKSLAISQLSDAVFNRNTICMWKLLRF